MKRQRGRGRKPGGGGQFHSHNNQGHQHPNRSLETNGPDTKFRGTASFIHERYLQLARDAASSGDRVLSENYMQHADHYFRLVRSMQPATPPPQQNERFSDEGEGDDEGVAREHGGETAMVAEGEDQSRPDFNAGSDAPDRDGDPHRRGRGRRNRFRPEGGREPLDARDGDEPQFERDASEPREPRRERAPRERAAEGPEGFSSGPKPAFLRGGD